MSTPDIDLTALVSELEEAANRLRDSVLPAEEAPALVERCAALSAEIAAELDRRLRELESDTPEQEPLL